MIGCQTASEMSGVGRSIKLNPLTSSNTFMFCVMMSVCSCVRCRCRNK